MEPRPSKTEPLTVRWLALVLAEGCRTILGLIAKEIPEARGKVTCSKCGHRG